VINFEVTGADALVVRFQKMLERMQDLSQPLNAAGVVVRDAAVMRIKNQGGDQSWPPNKRGGHTGILSGRMWQSIAVTPIDGGVQIGTNVVAPSGVSYPTLFQEGSGIFAGRSAWTVKPKTAAALYWEDAGGGHFAKSAFIPGQPARPFLLIGDSERTRISALFARFIAGI
jgi:phage gpG-like protein